MTTALQRDPRVHGERPPRRLAPVTTIPRPRVHPPVPDRGLALPVDLVESGDRIIRRSGSVLFGEGDATQSFYVVRAGRVKLTKHYPDGRDVLIALLGPGEYFGECSVLTSGTRDVTATVIADAALDRIPGAALRDWIVTNPRQGLALFAATARRLRATREEAVDLICKDVAARVAKQLLDFGRRFGTSDGTCIYAHHGLNQNELGQLVGSSRETVNKTLSSFATRGWISIEPGAVVIRDEARLRERADR